MVGTSWGEVPQTERDLESALSEPSPALVDAIAGMGNIVVLGAGGKMGPTVCRMARRAQRLAGVSAHVHAVSRFGDEQQAMGLAEADIDVVRANLLDPAAYASLPDADSLIYMVGYKFGATKESPRTWATNTAVAAWAADRYRRARTVVFSTGNVYPMTPIAYVGATEHTEPAPTGEYAQSCLGRERLFEYASQGWEARVLLLRLNYAVELRYGVLVDIGQSVLHGRPVNVEMGVVNVIWQADACDIAIRSLAHAESPASVLNVTGPESVSVRRVAHWFGQRFGREPQLIGAEGGAALLSDATVAMSRYGYPRMPLGRVLEWTAQWLLSGGPTLGKPTHFEEREGRF